MRLTVIIPTYNRSALLGRALRLLLDEQTAAPSDYELVVVDDGSTDGTPEVVKAVGAPESRLRYFRQENQGPAAARNLGVREAKGKIVLFTGDDCLPDRRLIEEHLRAHDRSGDVGVVGHVAWHPDLELTPLMLFLDQGAQFGFGYINDPDHVSAWSFYTANCSVQRHWIEEVGGFDEDFENAAYEDIELAYRMQQRGLRIIYHRPALTYHHHAPTLEGHLVRQRLCGRSSVIFWRKHPELKEELDIVEAQRPRYALQFFEAVGAYAKALGVREVLRQQILLREQGQEAEGGPAPDPQAWVREALGTADPDREELIRLRAELRDMEQEWQRVTSRRLYRWSEAGARAGWSFLRRLGIRP